MTTLMHPALAVTTGITGSAYKYSVTPYSGYIRQFTISETILGFSWWSADTSVYASHTVPRRNQLWPDIQWHHLSYRRVVGT